MVVAKRRGREKPTKIEQRKVCGPQIKQTALLASPIYTGQAWGGAGRGWGAGAGREHIKRGAKIGPGASLLFGVFWVGPPSHLEDVFSFAF